MEALYICLSRSPLGWMGFMENTHLINKTNLIHNLPQIPSNITVK